MSVGGHDVGNGCTRTCWIIRTVHRLGEVKEKNTPIKRDANAITKFFSNSEHLKSSMNASIMQKQYPSSTSLVTMNQCQELLEVKHLKRH